jgi:glycosyltransferase involved in cell wall biosynthesis
MHDVETVATVLPQALSRRFIWCFHAGGVGCRKLKERTAGLPYVGFGAALDDSEWERTMLSASIALVTIARGGEKVVMPSKTYSALVAGQAILAICVRESDLADLVIEHDCGWVVEPGDIDGLTALLEHLAAHPDEILAKRRNAYRVGHEHYSMRPIAKQWMALFEELQISSIFTTK